MKYDPIIYLGIDNCFASKRWTFPEEWSKLISEIGINYIEASADTECDPLYLGQDYTQSWIDRVKKSCETNKVSIANLYSGHGTYSTLGLGHWDADVRARFREQWMKPQAKTAADLGAGFGFFAHAFDENMLQNPDEYKKAYDELCKNLSEIAEYAVSVGTKSVGVEQMYSPHQPPWTIKGAKEMLRQIYSHNCAPFYLTDDVGHMNGQQFFQKPTEESILLELKEYQKDHKRKKIWMGSKKAMEAFFEAANNERVVLKSIDYILKESEIHPYMFAEKCDYDPYLWIEETGRWSPIIHLQQSDGLSSPHWPFDEKHNSLGIIQGDKLLRSLEKSFNKEPESDMPPVCSEITLTLEPFISTAGNIYDSIDELKDSVCYWRNFIPRDGMKLSELISLLPSE